MRIFDFHFILNCKTAQDAITHYPRETSFLPTNDTMIHSLCWNINSCLCSNCNSFVTNTIQSACKLKSLSYNLRSMDM